MPTTTEHKAKNAIAAVKPYHPFFRTANSILKIVYLILLTSADLELRVVAGRVIWRHWNPMTYFGGFVVLHHRGIPNRGWRVVFDDRTTRTLVAGARSGPVMNPFDAIMVRAWLD